MLEATGVELFSGSREERLPGFSPDFPYLASRARPDLFPIPWHWHRSVELFYMEQGALTYDTPKGQYFFPTGSGGLVNSNVLHRTRPLRSKGPCIQLLHIFAPSFLGGGQESRIDQRYILPLTVSGPEILPLSPGQPEQAALLTELRTLFFLSPQVFGYELKLRASLTRIWLELLSLSTLRREPERDRSLDGGKLKSILTYIHEHYDEPLRTTTLAAAGAVSERECYRLFQRQLRMTPAEYVRSVRLQAACRRLAQGDASLTTIAQHCGLGSSSRFGAVFRAQMGCTPLEYRRKWRDQDRIRRDGDSL